MRRVVQSRTGEDGNCFAACLASILNLPLSSVPEMSTDDQAERANTFLAGRGLSYRRVPIDGRKPSGWSTIEGVSPRGGMHACVARDGELAWDPHPIEDGTGQGLVEPRYYGLIERLPGRAKDSQTQLEKLRVKAMKPGPFTVQLTEPDGREHTESVKKLRAYDASTATIASLLAAFWAWYELRHPEPAETYDLTKYQPKRKTFDAGYTCKGGCGRTVASRYVNSWCQYCLEEAMQKRRAHLAPFKAAVEAARGDATKYKPAVQALKVAEKVRFLPD